MLDDKKPTGFHLMNAIRDAQFGCPYKVALMLVLATRSKAERGFACSTSQERLMADTGMKRSKLIATARALEKQGVIKRRVQYAHATSYWLIYDNILALAEPNRAEAKRKRAELLATPGDSEVNSYPTEPDDGAGVFMSDYADQTTSPEDNDAEEKVAMELTLYLMRSINHRSVDDPKRVKKACQAMRSCLADGRDADEVRRVIDWSLTKKFWREKFVEAEHPCNSFLFSWGELVNQKAKQGHAKLDPPRLATSTALDMMLKINAARNESRELRD